MISLDDFSKIEIRVGKVLTANNVAGSEKLIRLTVDFGDFGEQVIFTGVRVYGYQPEDFRGKQFLFVTNLKPRKMPSYIETSEGKVPEESQGMILAVDSLPAGGSPQVDGEWGKKPLFISAENLPLGSRVR